MTLIHARVTTPQRHTLRALAAAFKGTCWASERAPQGWTWVFEFPTLEQAQQFLNALSGDCQSVLERLPDPPVLPLETPEPASDRQPPRLFAFCEWSERAEALGLRLSRYGNRVFALRRESDGELMADDLNWAQTATLIEQLQGNGRQAEG